MGGGMFDNADKNSIEMFAKFFSDIYRNYIMENNIVINGRNHKAIIDLSAYQQNIPAMNSSIPVTALNKNKKFNEIKITGQQILDIITKMFTPLKI